MTTIIQISDTHITAPGALAYRRVDTHAALRKAVSHINALTARLGPIDAVVVSGDLAEFGTDEEYAAFRALTADLAPPLFVLPGNHDDRAALRRAFVDADYLPVGDGPLDYAQIIGACRLVALDTSVPDQPYGALNTDQLDWLEKTLSGHPQAPTLVFMHHPPFPTGIGHMDRQALRDPEPFLDVVRRAPQVRLVSSGHVHRTTMTSIEGVTCVIAPSPSHAVRLDMSAGAEALFDREPGAVLAHVWRGGQLLSHLSFIDAYDGPHPFFDEHNRLLR